MNYLRKLLTYGGVLAICLCLLSSTANASEIQLLGIKLGSYGMKVLQKYGNPTEIKVGGSSNGALGGSPMGPGARPGMGMQRPGLGGHGMRPGMGPGMRPGMGMRGYTGKTNPVSRIMTAMLHFVSSAVRSAFIPGAGSSSPTGGTLVAQLPGAFPQRPLMGIGPNRPFGPGGRPGMMGPGAGGMPPFGPGVQQGQNAAPARGSDVTWVYKFPGNRTAEFNLNPDGIVTQIAIYGPKWMGQRTSKGVMLGTMYKDVLKRYGYPENQVQQGIQLLLKYSRRDRVVFTLVGRTVVGITIAL